MALLPEHAATLNRLSPADEHAVVSPPYAIRPRQANLDGPPCLDCGGLTQQTGACYTCVSCGSTTGCG